MTADIAKLKALADSLRERTAMRFMADCKCGSCQCVPRDLIDQAVSALSRIEELEKERDRAAQGFQFHAARAEREREGRLVAEKQVADLEAALQSHREDCEYVVGWNDGFDHAAEHEFKFPTMIRKMWSGGEVQKWLDENLAALRTRKALGDQP